MKLLSREYKGIEVIQSTMERLPEIEEFKEVGWQKALKIAKERGHKLFDGALLRFEGMKKGIINVSKGVSYKDVVGLRANDFSHLLKYEDKHLPDTFSVMSIPVIDNKIVLSWRDEGDWKADYEVCGGFVYEDVIDPTTAIKNHIKRDLHAGCEKIHVIAIYQMREIAETTILFKVHIDRKPRNKHILCGDNPAEIEEMLKTTNLHNPSYIALKTYLGELK